MKRFGFVLSVFVLGSFSSAFAGGKDTLVCGFNSGEWDQARIEIVRDFSGRGIDGEPVDVTLKLFAKGYDLFDQPQTISHEAVFSARSGREISPSSQTWSVLDSRTKSFIRIRNISEFSRDLNGFPGRSIEFTIPSPDKRAKSLTLRGVLVRGILRNPVVPPSGRGDLGMVLVGSLSVNLFDGKSEVLNGGEKTMSCVGTLNELIR